MATQPSPQPGANSAEQLLAAFPASEEQALVATYLIATTSPEQAHARARDICVEQTVEFPEDLITSTAIREHILGRILSIDDTGEGTHRVRIAFNPSVTGFELTQFLNVVYGNISLKPGIRLLDLGLPRSLQEAFGGPRFGVGGLRNKVGVAQRPLFCSAIKPMGLAPRELATMASALAAGGLDMVKDDHGLADQRFSPFAERVARCAEAIAAANAQHGSHTIYCPNVSGPLETLLERAHLAATAGAGALMVAPGLSGFDALRMLRDAPGLELPLLCHPAFLGAFSAAPHHGLSHALVYGLLPRLAGADVSIFPSFGGRFSFSPGECAAISAACRRPSHGHRTWPAPAGGMTLAKVPELLAFYGNDTVLLIGGDLHRHGPDLADNTRRFMTRVTDLCA